jgi:CBS domain-containing protein
MKARDIMTTNPACCTPESTAYEAARVMAECDCGVIPVVENTESMRLVGVVTDRDLAVRGLAQGKGADTKVRDLMTRTPSCCGPDDDVKTIERVMAEKQVRRVPILDEEERCVGIIAQADLARAAERKEGISDREIATVVEKISGPSPQASGGAAATSRPDVRL